MTRVLKTASDVIDALGGMPEVGKLTGYTAKAVWNWKASGTFPSKTFVVLTDALHDSGWTAPASLWSMVEPMETS